MKGASCEYVFIIAAPVYGEYWSCVGTCVLYIPFQKKAL